MPAKLKNKPSPFALALFQRIHAIQTQEDTFHTLSDIYEQLQLPGLTKASLQRYLNRYEKYGLRKKKAYRSDCAVFYHFFIPHAYRQSQRLE